MDSFITTQENAKSTCEEAKKVVSITSKFTFEKLLDMISTEKLWDLSNFFKVHPKGVTQPQFIEAVKKLVQHDPNEEFDLIHGLSKLFTEIDINLSRRLTWSEFSQHIIDSVITNRVTKNVHGELPNQRHLLEQVHASHFKLPRFAEVSGVDNCIHEGLILKVAYYESINRIFLLESKSHMLKYMTPNLRKKAVIDLYGKDADGEESANTAKNESYFVIAAVYNEKDELLVCTCSNKTIHLFKKHKDSFARVKVIRTQANQYAVWYLERHKAWITASYCPEKKDFELRLRNASSQQLGQSLGPNFINDWGYQALSSELLIYRSIHAHDDQIMHCIEILRPPAIMTCSLDHHIRLWDLSTGERIGSLQPEHKSGVRYLDYMPSCNDVTHVLCVDTLSLIHICRCRRAI
eukprot:TRINITY_DN16679_c0_g1_i1.p1 TRINITY_DN16679_c0_g1~~TRINITY_DN16679_c0_g1_i1.p1  ORF type:complete len:407 (-),score=87.34 TRINITY_DN16679_c0_g1_i1:40-1260(-)